MAWMSAIVRSTIVCRQQFAQALQSVCADDIGGGQMFNDEMVANRIEGVFVQAGRVGLFKPFVEFEIEYSETQSLRCPDF